MTKIFINCSNHPSTNWGNKQRKAAEKYGSIIDISFPPVDPVATTEEVIEIAKKMVNTILSMNPVAVLCQGEFTVTLAIVRGLQNKGVHVFSACSERKTEERIDQNGLTTKVAVFDFCQFREYPIC